MEGAENVTMPDMTHVQSATSSQTFIQIFKFFRNSLPQHDIVPQKSIQLAGKALEFPQNTGLVGDTVEVWPVNFNGERTTKRRLPHSRSLTVLRLEELGDRCRPNRASAMNSRS